MTGTMVISMLFQAIALAMTALECFKRKSLSRVFHCYGDRAEEETTGGDELERELDKKVQETSGASEGHNTLTSFQEAANNEKNAADVDQVRVLETIRLECTEIKAKLVEQDAFKTEVLELLKTATIQPPPRASTSGAVQSSNIGGQANVKLSPYISELDLTGIALLPLSSTRPSVHVCATRECECSHVRTRVFVLI